MSESCPSIQLACFSSAVRMRSSNSRVPLSPALRACSTPPLSIPMASFSPPRSSARCSLLNAEIELPLRAHRLPDVDLGEPLQVGHTLEKQDALDDQVGVLHLADRLLAHLLPQPLIAPVLAHASVDEVLVDRGQLGGED